MLPTAVPSAPCRPRPPQPDPAASAVWERFTPYRATLVRAIEGRCVDRASAEDLVQDTLLRAALSRSARRGVAHPRAWLERIAINLMKDRAREPRPNSLDDAVALGMEPRCSGPVPGDDAESSWVPSPRGPIRAALLVDDLQAVLDGLPARDRQILHGYYVECVALPELLRRAGANPRLGKVWLYRARHRLRERLLRRCALLDACGGGA